MGRCRWRDVRGRRGTGGGGREAGEAARGAGAEEALPGAGGSSPVARELPAEAGREDLAAAGSRGQQGPQDAVLDGAAGRAGLEAVLSPVTAAT